MARRTNEKIPYVEWHHGRYRVRYPVSKKAQSREQDLRHVPHGSI
jgi:hypothetical protein